MEKNIVKYGVVHGRFQLLHNGHLKGLLLPAKENCEFLVVGICNPSVEQTNFDDTNPHRSELSNNPFSYWDRYLMIKNSLIESGVSESNFCIVPFPINFPQQISNYIPKDSVHFMTIYDDWGKKKMFELNKQGFKTFIIKDFINEEREFSGSMLREMLKTGNDQWKKYVPTSVVKIVEDLELYKK